jgi:hypothetical protein
MEDRVCVELCHGGTGRSMADWGMCRLVSLRYRCKSTYGRLRMCKFGHCGTGVDLHMADWLSVELCHCGIDVDLWQTEVCVELCHCGTGVNLHMADGVCAELCHCETGVDLWQTGVCVEL